MNSDASELAYGACTYSRSIDSARVIFLNFLCSKTRVAPIKIISIPLVEICAVFLLAALVHKVKTSLDLIIKLFISAITL